MSRKFWLVAICCCMLLTMAAQSDKSYRAERFDVDINVQNDGSLLVEESVTFEFSGGPFSYVFRELPTDHTDGITNIVARTNGEFLPEGDGPGEVEISGNNPIEVVWHLPPTANTTQTFDLSYQVLGVVSQEDEFDMLVWQALPDEYEYAIDSSEITFNYPAGAQLAGNPELLSGSGDQWSFEQGPGFTTFHAENLSPGDPFVARLPFAAGSLTTTPPAWQAARDTQNSRAWIWFVAAAFILGGGIAAFYAAARPFWRSVPKASSYLYKPPLELPPALAGYLASSTVGWQQGLATLFDMAGRGHVTIEQISEKSLLRGPEFAITLLEHPQNLRPHEQALVDLLFTDKNGIEQEVITLSEMGKLITSSRWKKFTHALEDEAAQEGLLDENAKRRQKQLVVWGVLLLLMGIPLLMAAYLLREPFGMWTLVAVGAVALVGFFGLLFAAAISPLSQKGYQFASAFEPFRHLLKDVTRGKAELPDLSYYIAHLPYATAYGLAEPWVKQQSKSGYEQIPEYFRAVQSSGAEMAAFVAVISAASHSGGAAGAAAGAAGAAAAGGGASGAG